MRAAIGKLELEAPELGARRSQRNQKDAQELNLHRFRFSLSILENYGYDYTAVNIRRRTLAERLAQPQWLLCKRRVANCKRRTVNASSAKATAPI